MSSALNDELEENFKLFESQWPKDFGAAFTALSTSKKYFISSYVRISSIQAWRTTIMLEAMDDDSLAFFFEAQNDFLISHCLARSGSFRQALKSLRSAIENILFALYYKDHPVELTKWVLGQHKLGFTEMIKYFEGHPLLQKLSPSESGLDVLKTEYGTLSRAVHGSAKEFRMTQNLTDIQLWSTATPSVGKWASREKAVITAFNLLLLQMFQSQLTGSQRLNLREVLGLIIPKNRHASIKSKLKITLVGA